MERLTYREDGMPFVIGINGKTADSVEIMDAVIERLADYEDMMKRWRMTEIRDIDLIFRRVNALGGMDLMAQCHDAVADLAHYKQLEAEGRLIELPCKVGDTVWRVIKHCTESEFGDCVGCTRNENGACQPKYFEQAFLVGLYDQIGKTAFLDRESALAKLEGEK